MDVPMEDAQSDRDAAQRVAEFITNLDAEIRQRDAVPARHVKITTLDDGTPVIALLLADGSYHKYGYTLGADGHWSRLVTVEMRPCIGSFC